MASMTSIATPNEFTSTTSRSPGSSPSMANTSTSSGVLMLPRRYARLLTSRMTVRAVSKVSFGSPCTRRVGYLSGSMPTFPSV